MARTDQSERPLPFLVRLHGATVRTVRASLIANLGATAIFFGLPLLVIGILWPQELPETVQDMQLTYSLVFPLVLMALLRVCCTSPDPTGGLGNTQVPTNNIRHP